MLSLIQIAVSVVLVGLILFQERGGGGLTGILGGESGATFYQTRRGLEKVIFGATIVFGITFVVIAILRILL